MSAGRSKLSVTTVRRRKQRQSALEFGWGKGTGGRTMADACDMFLTQRGLRSLSMADLIGLGAKEAKQEKEKQARVRKVRRESAVERAALEIEEGWLD